MAFREFRQRFVSERHPTIARRFNAGLSRQYKQVPEGRQNIQLLNLIFFRPSGTRDGGWRKALGLAAIRTLTQKSLSPLQQGRAAYAPGPA